MTDAPSWWWADLGGLPAARPSLERDRDADVCIVGAGYTGLWTAYELRRADPSLEVVVLEREVAGFGASGRNGGWCVADFPVSPAVLTKRYGRDAARAVFLAMIDSVDDIGRVVQEEGIDAHYAHGGGLYIARADYDLPKIEEMWEEYRSIGLEDRVALFDADQTTERMRVADAVGGWRARSSAAAVASSNRQPSSITPAAPRPG